MKDADRKHISGSSREANREDPDKRRASGQGMVELAFVLPFVCLLILGIVDFSLLMVSASSLSTGSRDAARYAASSGTGGAGVPHYQDCQAIRSIATSISLFGQPDITIEYDPDGPGETAAYEYCQQGMATDTIDAELGGRIIVTVARAYESMTGQIFFELPSIPLSARTARSIVKEIPVK